MGRQNGITIEDILKMDCMEKSKLIAGAKGTRNTVSKVNIMADPDIMSWVSEGELLLTTAYSFKKDDTEIQKKLIKECAKKGLAGIGIKIYPYLEALSKEVIDLADELGFPIIDLYYGTAFADIMAPVFKEIFNKQAILLQRLEKIHEKLMSAMITGQNIDNIAQVIYENISNPIMVKLEFPSQTIVKINSKDTTLKTLLLENANRFYLLSQKSSKEGRFRESTELLGGKYIKRMIMPIVVENSVYGHIFSWATNSPLGGFDLSVLETASTTIALEILKELSIRDVENRYRTEFFEDLISLDYKRKEKALERASFFKLRPEISYAIVVINIKDNQKNSDKPNYTINTMQQNITKIVPFIEKTMEDMNLKGIVVGKTESINILITLKDRNHINPSLSVFGEKLERLIANKISTAIFRIGIGRPYLDIKNAYKSYIDAIRAIRTGDILNEEKVIDFDKLGIYKILCQEALGEELDKFYDVTIKSLVEYDKHKSTDLIKTLEMYFKYNGNLKKMSEAMFTHYNTILYRIQRIKEITGMELDNDIDRLNLEVGLKIKKIIKR